jgi:hypothetical protein
MNFAAMRKQLTEGTNFKLSAISMLRSGMRTEEGGNKLLGNLSDFKEEISSFLRNPTVGSALSLTEPGTKTAAVLKSLGTAGAIARVSIVGLTAAFEAFKLIGDLMEKALEQVLNRIDDIWKFSGVLANAKVNESIQKMNDAFKEAADNGRVYAKVLEANTFAESSKTWMASQFNSAMSGFIRLWTYGKGAFYRLIGSVFYAAASVARFGEYLKGIIYEKSDMIEYLLKSMGFMTEWLIPILKFLGIIADNTKPKVDPNTFNGWIKADIKAMTGVDYDRKPSTYGIGIAKP